jgi:hypothetical protein
MLQLCDELNRAFAAVRRGEPCREWLTPLIRADINRCYQSEYLLSAAVNVYFAQKSFENVDCLLELGADPSYGSWDALGEYLNDKPYHYPSRWASVGSIEYATRMDDLELLKRFITCSKCNESHVMFAFHEARAGTATRAYLSAVMDQLDLMSPSKYRAHIHNWPVNRKGLSYLLTMAPKSPILILKSMEEGPLRTLFDLYKDVMLSLHNIRVVFFNQESSAAALPVDVVKLAASFLTDFTADELSNLQAYGKILKLGFSVETYFSYACVYRVQLRTHPQSRW